ncbi:MAG TPA: hypothetical protein VHU19_06315 [Pyrinomonadaceae bacterium]|jgi:hypothetical protein|nr:hypothetical protein [Pyrinomonadaceae bacterium]
MSVLSFPRIYFNGYMGWDPATGNNNDYQPINDGQNASLNWDYLNSYGVTGPLGPTGPTGGTGPFTSDFRNWFIGGEPDPCPSGPTAPPTPDTSSDCSGPSGPTMDNCHMGSRWNYYGGNGCWFVDYPTGGKRTLTTGGDLAFGQSAPGNDPIIGKPVVITGNTFGGRASHARLVDIDPYAPWSSQIIFSGVRIGDEQTYIAGQQYLRMHSRLFFVPRTTAPLIIAGAIGVIFQTTFPNNTKYLQSNPGNSQLLKTLLNAMQQQGAQGLMLRFTVFNTLYYQNGVFNDFKHKPTTADQIEAMYRNGEVFSNPAYSTAVGVFGVWNQGELSTAPGGHVLVSVGAPGPTGTANSAFIHQLDTVSVAGHGEVRITSKLVPNPDAPARLSGVEKADASRRLGAAPSAPPPIPLGTALAEIGPTGNYISLDLSNAIPEVGATGASGHPSKYNYGPITVGVQGPTGNFTPIGSFSNYDWKSYLSKGGIVDVLFKNNITSSQVRQWLQQGGLLALQINNSLAAIEQPLYAETDSRGIYLDQGATGQMTVQVRLKNGTPPAGTRLLLAQYYPWGLNTAVGNWQLSGTTGPMWPAGDCNAVPPGQYLNFPGASGPTAIVPVTIPKLNGATAPYGEATVTVAHNQPGFPIVAFYPFTGPTAPQPLPQVGFGGGDPTSYNIGTAHFSNVRAMPADNYLLQEFVDCWNGTGSYTGTPPYNRLQTWNFIYQNILYVYDALYPVMDQFMPLGSLESVEAAIDQLVTMISAGWVDSSTLYMPVTRELSAAKRCILLTWGDLVNRKYPQEPLPFPLPCDE